MKISWQRTCLVAIPKTTSQKSTQESVLLRQKKPQFQ